ncbi:carbonic anhydrase [Thiocystis violacea]|uniref:carbonic anhydrase n=1 Tax=Thiocystis violacea TaxID=13725 RepID=UPI001902CFBE|nr:carbonic anhydrase family protein [Thiocystis violacea]MBK1723445.1 carbonate dehydratase [Thiocystis violacea]
MYKSVILTLSLAAAGTAIAADHSAHWGYTGETGPEHWGDLDSHFELCKNGKNQSPVDLAHIVDSQLPPIGFHYSSGGVDEINNGHSVQIDYDAGSTISLDGHDYELKQFHFHTPSENHINGKEYPMEAHLVHADADGNLAVIAVMFEEGPANAALAQPWSVIPGHAGEHAHLATKASAEGLLPADRDYYRFNGSLTTPPCSEGVVWLVLKQPVTASAEQISTFSKVMGHPNNRPIQRLNARLVID